MIQNFAIFPVVTITVLPAFPREILVIAKDLLHFLGWRWKIKKKNRPEDDLVYRILLKSKKVNRIT